MEVSKNRKYRPLDLVDALPPDASISCYVEVSVRHCMQSLGGQCRFFKSTFYIDDLVRSLLLIVSFDILLLLLSFLCRLSLF
jgi:hypothetical protein